MVKKRIDMRNGISKYLDKDEKILNVYFLIEEEKSNFYHLCAPVVVTNKAVYFDYKGFYSFDSVGAKGGGFQNIKDLVKDIANSQNKTDFNILCVKNKDLDALENTNRFEIKNIPYPVISNKCDRLVKEAKGILNNILEGKL